MLPHPRGFDLTHSFNIGLPSPLSIHDNHVRDASVDVGDRHGISLALAGVANPSRGPFARIEACS